jgi:hypothetical protein
LEETSSWQKIETKGDIPSARTGCLGVNVGTKFFIFAGFNDENGQF